MNVHRCRMAAVLLLAGLFVVGCSGGAGPDADATDPAAGGSGSGSSQTAATAASPPIVIDDVVDIGGGRNLYVRCRGTGSPTVVLEGGDEDTSDSYRFAEFRLALVTTTCVYDRANLGRSGSAPGPRGLTDLVGDLERLLDAAEIPAPYVLVGTSGGGYITSSYAAAHPDQIAGLVFVETPAPDPDPPPEVITATAWDNPSNIEKRDYLQVERDSWAARAEIGDIPVTIISNDYGPDAEVEGERRNVADQQGWFVLSPRAEQIVVHTGHAVEEGDPGLVIEAILEVVREAQ